MLGLAGLAIATREAMRASDGVALPGPLPLLAATVLTLAGLACTARAWVVLIGPPADERLLRRSFYASQLVKYLPAGGAVQAAGQVSMAATLGIPLGTVSVALAVLMACTVASGAAVGSLLALVEGLPWWVRVASLAGLAAPALVRHSTLALGLRAARRVVRRVPAADSLPPPDAVRRAMGWCVANHLLFAVGFAVLLRATDAEVSPLSAAVPYTVAWVAGFLVVPLPSGLGIREAVLLALVPSASTAAILAASVAQRVANIVAEVIAVVGNRVGPSARRPAGRDPGDSMGPQE